MITVRILNISDFFHDLLSGILHQKIPNHILPNSRKDIISRSYYAYNALLSIVCMEWILLICHNIEKSLHFKQREDKYYLGQILQNLLDGKAVDDSTQASNIRILNSYLNDFLQYRDKINIAYTQTVDEYIKLLSESKNYRPSIHQRFS